MASASRHDAVSAGPEMLTPEKARQVSDRCVRRELHRESISLAPLMQLRWTSAVALSAVTCSCDAPDTGHATPKVSLENCLIQVSIRRPVSPLW